MGHRIIQLQTRFGAIHRLVVIFAIIKNFHFRINAGYLKKPAEANLNLNSGTGIPACEIQNPGWKPVPPL